MLVSTHSTAQKEKDGSSSLFPLSKHWPSCQASHHHLPGSERPSRGKSEWKHPHEAPSWSGLGSQAGLKLHRGGGCVSIRDSPALGLNVTGSQKTQVGGTFVMITGMSHRSDRRGKTMMVIKRNGTGKKSTHPSGCFSLSEQGHLITYDTGGAGLDLHPLLPN